MKICFLIVLFFLTPSLSVAQQNNTPSQSNEESEQIDTKSLPELMSSHSQYAKKPPQKKSPTRAFGLSLGITTASWGLLIARDTWFKETCVGSCRVLGDSLGFIGFTGVLLGPSAGHLYAQEFQHAAITTTARIGSLLVGPLIGGKQGEQIGYLLALGISLYDVIDAPFSVKRANKKSKVFLQTTPIISRDGSISMGLSAKGSFF